MHDIRHVHSFLLQVCNDLVQTQIVKCDELRLGFDFLAVGESRDCQALLPLELQVDLDTTATAVLLQPKKITPHRVQWNSENSLWLNVWPFRMEPNRDRSGRAAAGSYEKLQFEL